MIDKKICRWQENSDGAWETSCENSFEFSVGTPKENKARFCIYCGKKIRQIILDYENKFPGDNQTYVDLPEPSGRTKV